MRITHSIIGTSAAIVVFATAFVRAEVPNTFQSGDLLTAAKLNDNFAALVDRTSDQMIAGAKTFTGEMRVENSSGTPAIRASSNSGDFGYVVSVATTGDNTKAIGVSNVTSQREVFVVYGSGNVVIGNLNNVPAAALQVVGDIRVGTTGSNGCIQNFAGGALVGTCSSDARLKQGIAAMSGALDKLARLQPVTYEWRQNEFPDRHFGAGRSAGLIAQEVEKVLPELVTTDDEGYKAVSYGVELDMLAIQAIKELRAENAALAERVARLEARQRRGSRR